VPRYRQPAPRGASQGRPVLIRREMVPKALPAMTRHFLTVRDFSAEETRATFALASEMKRAPERFAGALKGKALAMLFEKPSLRTRVSFDVGIQQLGGFSLYISPSEISLGKRESISDVAKNLERMVQLVMIRTFAHAIVTEMATHAHVPVINGLTDTHHPCQGMADYLTILEVKGKLEGLKVAYLGDGNNVAHSLVEGAARVGAHVAIGCPEGYDPKAEIVDWARANGAASVTVTHDPFEAAADADVVYTDVWASMGQESEAAARKAIFLPFQVNDELFGKAKSDAIFMHCLPAHRGEEVTASVIDGPRSVVFQQAENRLHAQKAIMKKLFE
jgi:ornithine carbamoyltransferase